MFEFLSGKKTYIAAAVMLIVAAAELAGIDVVTSLDQTTALQALWQAIMALFLRAGIAKSGLTS